MRTVKVVNESRGNVLGERVWLADGWWSRLRGLLGRGPLDPGMGMLIVPSRAVHMYGMRYPIDVAFLDDEAEVVTMYRGLAPGTRTRWHTEAKMALELPEGTLAASDTHPGDRLTWTETEEEE